jgi:superfamily II DNA or RNA helicase
VYGPIDEPILRRRAQSPVKKCFTYLHFLGFSTKILACVHKSDRLLAQDETRTATIVDNIIACLTEGRFPLVLTERKAHLDSIYRVLAAKTESSIAVLYGGQGKKARASAMAMIEPKVHSRRVVLATGKLVGEGFDIPDLDTLFIALPISWRGTLQQYVGRLARSSANKSIVRVYDYQDLGHPILLKMGEKRRIGYKMLGFAPAE